MEIRVNDISILCEFFQVEFLIVSNSSWNSYKWDSLNT